MKTNERLIVALKKTVEKCPEVELVKFMRYIGTIEDFAYMTDDDMAIQIEHYNKLFGFSKQKGLFDYQAKPNDAFYIDELLYIKNCNFYDFTKENEKIAYERYKTGTQGKVFFELVEKVNMSDFLKRFELEYVDTDDYADITVINHKDTFLNIMPMAYKHMNGYVVARKGEKYIAKHVYLVKFPCFGQLMDYVMQQCKEEYDECLVIAIDWYESPRFTNYTRRIMYGMEYRKKDKVVEIYNDHQTIEKFHEFFQRANKIVSDWDDVVFDDGTCDLE